MTIKIAQSSSYAGDRRWHWAVWLTGSAKALDQVDHVIYTLHPTFSNPIREIHDRKSGFRLKSNGWGEFTIYIDLVGKDGKHRQLTHELKLTDESEAPDEQKVDRDIALVSEMAARVTTESDSAANRQHTGLKQELGDLLQRAVEKVAEQLPPTTVFVSGGIADTDAIRKLGDALTALNVRVVGTEDISAGVPHQVAVADQIAQASMAVFLVSGRPSLWLNEEIETAKRHGKRIVPVLLGEESQLPESLSEFKSLRVGSLDKMADWARVLLK